MLGCVLGLGCFALASIVKAAQPLSFSVSKSQANDSTHIHIGFDAEDIPQFQTGKEGSILFIRFREIYAINTGALSAKLKPYVRSVSISEDQKAINLVFKESFEIKKQAGGVNISLNEAKSSANSHSQAVATTPEQFAALEPEAGPEPESTHAQSFQEKEASAATSSSKSDAVEKALPVVQQNEQVHLVPPASTLRAIEKQKRLAALRKKELLKKGQAPLNKALKQSQKDQPKKKEVASSILLPKKPVKTLKTEPVQQPVVEQVTQDNNPVKESQPTAREELTQGVSQDLDKIKAWDQLAKNDENDNSDTEGLPENIQNFPSVTVPWDQVVSLAVFYRAPYTWMVFDAYKRVDLNDFKHQIPQMKEIKQMVDKHYTILRLKHDAPLHIETRRKGNNWKLYVVEQATPPGRILSVKSLTQVQHRAGSYIPVSETGQIIRLSDHEIGDNLVINSLPFAEVGVP